jgi:hypothetical protein
METFRSIDFDWAGICLIGVGVNILRVRESDLELDGESGSIVVLAGLLEGKRVIRDVSVLSGEFKSLAELGVLLVDELEGFLRHLLNGIIESVELTVLV